MRVSKHPHLIIKASIKSFNSQYHTWQLLFKSVIQVRSG
jgi:hypothetical protein